MTAIDLLYATRPGPAILAASSPPSQGHYLAFERGLFLGAV